MVPSSDERPRDLCRCRDARAHWPAMHSHFVVRKLIAVLPLVVFERLERIELDYCPLVVDLRYTVLPQTSWVGRRPVTVQRLLEKFHCELQFLFVWLSGEYGVIKSSQQVAASILRP